MGVNVKVGDKVVLREYPADNSSGTLWDDSERIYVGSYAEVTEILSNDFRIRLFDGRNTIWPISYCASSTPTPPTPVKHSHYFKSVKGLDHIDVYRVLQLFNVTDPCIQHAVKKLLVAGGRGAGKDINRDIQESIDTLVRWQEMQTEGVGKC
jgi:hypothetical protein